MFDSGSQANLISEETVKKLKLETSPHPKPYPLGWICDNAKLQVTRKCKLRFAITANFVDEVELDVIPLDICGIVLGSPYLYDRKAIFYHQENKYHLFKDGVEYIVRAHTKKMNLSLINVGQMKRLVNASKNFVERALVRVSLVDNVEQGAGRIWRQARGGVPACPAGINDVQSVHLQAASPENAVLQEHKSEGNFTREW